MLTGIFVIITLLPFQIFFTLWNGLFTLLGLDLSIPIPDNFGEQMVSMLQKAYVFDWIFPTGVFINTALLAIKFFIAFNIWYLITWVYNKIRGI